MLGPIFALIVFGWFANGAPAVIAKTEPDLATCQADMAKVKANLDANHVKMGLTNAYLECVQSPTPEASAPAPDSNVDPIPPSGGQTQD